MSELGVARSDMLDGLTVLLIFLGGIFVGAAAVLLLWPG
jgi:hypothetical protein